MTTSPVNSTPDGQDDITMSQYRNQKLALEEASKQLNHKSSWPKISVIRPGGVATNPNIDNTKKSNVNEWAEMIIDCFTQNDNMHIVDISVGHTDQRIQI